MKGLHFRRVDEVLQHFNLQLSLLSEILQIQVNIDIRLIAFRVVDASFTVVGGVRCIVGQVHGAFLTLGSADGAASVVCVTGGTDAVPLLMRNVSPLTIL